VRDEKRGPRRLASVVDGEETEGMKKGAFSDPFLYVTRGREGVCEGEWRFERRKQKNT
jgi:hypothetical protein